MNAKDFEDVKDERATDYYNFLERKLLQSNKSDIFDPLSQEVKSRIDKYKFVYLLSFISCLIYIIVSGFETFYGGKYINEKFCGIILIPFISILLHLALIDPIKTEDEIRKELENWKMKLRRNDFDPFLPYFCLSLITIFGAAIIYSKKEEVNILSLSEMKLIMLGCIITTLSPFFIHQLEIRKIIRRYNDAAKKL